MTAPKQEMTILQHLAELRRRLIAVALVLLVCVCGCFYALPYIMPYITELGAGFKLVYIAPAELFLAYVQISFVCGVCISLPFTAYHIWAYTEKGLYQKEKLYLAAALSVGGLCFVLGAAFGYFAVLPITIDFLLRMGQGGIVPMVSIAQFLSFVFTTLLAFGAVFQLPVLATLLAKIGLLKSSFFKKHRPALVLGIFILAAIITPPDVFSQILMAVPMLLLTEISYWLCLMIERGKAKAQAKTAAVEMV